jgi:hypothetical protein
MDSAWIDLPPREVPLVFHWPETGAPSGLVTFEDASSSFDDVAGLSPSPFALPIGGFKYARAKKLYLASWIDTDRIEAAERVR